MLPNFAASVPAFRRSARSRVLAALLRAPRVLRRTTLRCCPLKKREAKRRKAHANHDARILCGMRSPSGASPRLCRLAGLPPTSFNSGPRFLGRRPDAERPAFPILQCSELLADRSLCRPGGVRVARERTANPRAGTALAPLSGVPSRRRPSMSEIYFERNLFEDATTEIWRDIGPPASRRFMSARPASQRMVLWIVTY